MELERTKVALLAEDLYDDHTLWYPRYRLREAGATIDVLGTGDSNYRSRHDYEVTADYTVDHAVASNYAGVVVPAGYAVDRMRLHRPTIHFVEELYRGGAVCAAVGHGSWLFASAGIVEDRRCTGVRSVREDLENAGADWVDKGVVSEERLVTCQGREQLPDFVREVIDALQESR